MPKKYNNVSLASVEEQDLLMGLRCPGDGSRGLCEDRPGLPHARHSCFHPVLASSNWFQLVPDSSRWFHTVPVGSRWFQLVLREPQTGKAQPLSEAGGASGKIYLIKGKKLHTE